jgi:hypothetical protein
MDVGFGAASAGGPKENGDAPPVAAVAGWVVLAAVCGPGLEKKDGPAPGVENACPSFLSAFGGWVGWVGGKPKLMGVAIVGGGAGPVEGAEKGKGFGFGSGLLPAPEGNVEACGCVTKSDGGFGAKLGVLISPPTPASCG